MFILTGVKFAHSIGIYLMKQYPEQPKPGGYRSRSRVRPLVDFSLPFFQTMALYVVSGTIVAAANASKFLDYFNSTAIFLAIDIFWSAAIGRLTYGEAWGPPMLLRRFAGLNLCTVALAYVARFLLLPAGTPDSRMPGALPWILLVLLLLRAVLDFRWSYNTLYPWAAVARM
ncbi:MAG TPA: hypothetical protein VGR57_12865 [Ktedonobacterales bacterium]|nr:hypothetical protein [Ktedonobacterales bacterium]